MSCDFEFKFKLKVEAKSGTRRFAISKLGGLEPSIGPHKYDSEESDLRIWPIILAVYNKIIVLDAPLASAQRGLLK